MSTVSSLGRIFLVTSLFSIAWSPLHAASLYWDSNGSTAGAGATPNGTWGTDSFWNTNSAGGAGNFTTTITEADTGFFSAGTDAVNSYTVTVNGTQIAGSLQFKNGTPTLTGGIIALSANAILTTATTLNGTATIESAITTNTTSGGTKLLTLTVNDGAAATDLLIKGGISATTPANTYQFRFAGAGNARIEGAISNHSGTLQGSWTGTVTIAGNQTLGSSGISLTTANNKLIMGDSTADVQSWSGGTTISLPSALMTIRSTATAGVITMRGGGGTLDVEGILNATGFTFGSNGVNDSSSFGTLKLSGGNASFTGSAFTIYGTGSKIIGGAASYGTLTMNNTSAFTIGSALTLGGNGTNENNLHLVKSGTSTLTLSGTNTYTGSTTINGGNLTLANQNAIQNSTLVMTGGGNLTFSSVETANAFTLGGLSASTSGSGYNIALTNNASAAIALTVGNNNASTTYAGVLSGSGSLIKTGSGTLTLSGNNSYSGGSTLNAGTLVLGHANGLSGSGTITFGGGTLQYGNGITTDLSSRLSNAASQAYAINTNGNDVTFATALASSGGTLAKFGTGNLTLSGTNTYTGGTTLNAGQININNATALGSGTFTIVGGTIDNTSAGAITLASNNAQNWNGDFTFTGTKDLNLGTGAVAMSASRTITVTAGNLTVGGAISGTGYALTKNGSGTLIVNGTNTYTGVTTVNAGTLTLSGGSAIVDTGAVGVASGAVLNLGASETVGTLYGAGNITLGSYTLTTNASSNTTFSGTVSGSGSMVKNGIGALTLSGSNSYTGGTTLNTGTLVLGHSNAVGNGTITQNSGSSLLTISTTGIISNAMSVYNVEVNQTATLSGGITVNNATFNITSGTTTISGDISGLGGITKNGAGALVLSGSNSYSSATTVNAGTLNAASAHALGANNTVTVNGGSLLVSADGALGGKNITLNSSTTIGLTFSGNYNGSIGTLTLSANSIIDLGEGNSVVAHFAAIAGLNNYILKIYNWSGTTLWNGGTGNNTDQIYFGSGVSGNLDRISFYSDFGNDFLGTGYQIMGGSFANQIIPVPEPETWAAALLLVAATFWPYLRGSAPIRLNREFKNAHQKQDIADQTL